MLSVLLAVQAGAMAAVPPMVRTDDTGARAVAIIGAAGKPGAGGDGSLGDRMPPEWMALGPFGGDADDVNQSPTTPSVLLAGIAPNGSTGGTLYRSTDSGATWTEVLALSGNSVFDVEFAPDGTAYIGTLDGVWRSTDGGASWTNLPLGIGLNDQVFEVAIDPNNASVLYAGVAGALGNQLRNLLKSVNGGASWIDITPLGASGTGCRGLAVEPTNSSEIMAVFGGAFGGGSIYHSIDGGASWTNRTGTVPANPMNDVINVGGDWIVCGGLQFGSQVVGVFRSANDGVSWTELSNLAWPSLVVEDLDVDPANPSNLIAATVAGMNRSNDGGASWTLQAGGTAPWSMNSARYASSTRIIAGLDSLGIGISDDAGASFTLSSEGIGALNVFSVAANPQNLDELALAFQALNSGGVMSSTDAGVSWTLETGLPGTRYNTVEFAPDGTLYAISDGPTGGGVKEALYRKNGPGSWTSLGPDQGALFESELFGLDFSQTDPNLIMTSGSDFGVAGNEPTVWRTIDAGANWTKVYEGADDFEDVNKVLIVHDGTDQTMVACFTDFSSAQTGGVLRSTNGGVTWGPIVAGLSPDAQGFDLAVDPADAMTFFFGDGDTGAGNGGLYRSTDAGATWAALATGFDPRAIAINPGDNTDIAASSFGQPRVRRSTDGGSSFAGFQDGLSTSLVANDLDGVGGPSPRYYLAGNGGIFAFELGAPCQPDLTGSIDPNDPGFGVPDGVLDANDFFFYLGLFGAGDLAADLTGSINPNDPGFGVPDGTLDANDFFFYLDLFATGCP